MRQQIKILTVVVTLFFISITVFAGIEEEKLMFRSKCGQCHKSGGSAPVFAPAKYASRQWKRFFDRRKHRRKKDISGMIKKEELEMIKMYLMDHSADSPQPEAAGLK